VDAPETLPNRTLAPLRKLAPKIATAVPPGTEPLLGEMLEILGADAVATMRESPTVAYVDFESSAFIVKEKVPDAVGVPVIVPVVALN
jgi:hypothetical protein